MKLLSDSKEAHMTDFGEKLNEWVEVTNRNPLEDDEKSGILQSFLQGWVEGCVIFWCVLMVTALFMRIFRHKELGWVDIVR